MNAQTTLERTPLDRDIEEILFRRVATDRLDGYTVETAREIMGLVARSPAIAGVAARENIARALLDRRGFGFYLDPMEGGQDAYDITLEALADADAMLAALPPSQEVPAQAQTTCCQGLAPSSECRCEQERLAAGKPPYQRGETAGVVPQRPADALRLLADLFSQSLHQTWTRGEIVNVIEDAIRLGSSHARPDSETP